MCEGHHEAEGCGCAEHHGRGHREGDCGCGGHRGHHHAGHCACGHHHGEGCCCDRRSGYDFRRRFWTKEEQAVELEAYLKALEAEAQGVREAIAALHAAPPQG